MTAGKKLIIPPSLSKVVSVADRYGNPRPTDEVQAEIAGKSAAHKVWAKKYGYAHNSHWRVRKMFHVPETDGWRKTMAELIGEEELRYIEKGMGLNALIAAKMTLRRALARRVLDGARGPGRPRTPRQRLVAMMVSVEAYIGSGLSVDAALGRAHDKWGNTIGRFSDIYKETKLPQYGGRDLLRAFFYKTKMEEVDKFIAAFRASETAGE